METEKLNDEFVMPTDKLNNIVKKTPNKLYTILAAARAAERNRLGKFGKQLYVPHNPFITEKVMGEIEHEATRNINRQEPKKSREDSF